MAIYPLSAGHPDYSSSGTIKLIPEIFSARLAEKYYGKAVVTAITNTNWEGEIKNQGDKVIIRVLGDTTVGNYKKGQDVDWQVPEDSSINLLIDKGKYWAVRADDVDLKQMDVDMYTKWQEDGAEQFKKQIDIDVLQNVYSDAHASNQGATAGVESGLFNLGAASAPVTVTDTNILQYIVDCGTVLDEQNNTVLDHYFQKYLESHFHDVHLYQ